MTSDKNFDLAVPATEYLTNNLIDHLQRAIRFRPQGRSDLACLAAEKMEAMMSLEKLKSQQGKPAFVLPVFEWGVIRSQLAALFVGTQRRDQGVLATFWGIYESMDADPRWQELEKDRIKQEERKERIERIRRRYEREKAILLAEYQKTGDITISQTLKIGVY